MIAFWLIAAAMIAAALAVALPALLQRGGPTPDRIHSQQTTATLEAYRERLAHLERDRARGELSGEDFEAAREELERELLEEVPAEPRAGAAPRLSGGTLTIAAVAVLIPAVTLGTYLSTGRPDLVGADQAGRLTAAQAEQYGRMAPQERIPPLESYVTEHPQAPRAWALLADAYRQVERYGDAVTAFGRAREAGMAEDGRLIARQAESLLLANGRRFTSSVQRLIDEALAADPRNPLGLMLAGHAALTRGEHESAVGYWQRLAEQIPENDRRRQMVEDLIARAEEQPDAATATSASAAARSGPAIRVRVSLADALRERAEPGDTVFIFARDADTADGPPLAVRRTTVGDLPAALELTDDDAMLPDAELSSAERVVVTARVSRTGDVSAQSGDLEGATSPLPTDRDDPVTLTIDHLVD